jgi:hypothetical protein
MSSSPSFSAFPPDNPDFSSQKPQLRTVAEQLFPGIELNDPDTPGGGIQVFHVAGVAGQSQFYHWTATGTHTSPDLFGFDGTLRSVVIRVVTITDPGQSPTDPSATHVWDQLSVLAQVGVRAVGRPVTGPIRPAPPRPNPS